MLQVQSLELIHALPNRSVTLFRLFYSQEFHALLVRYHSFSSELLLCDFLKIFRKTLAVQGCAAKLGLTLTAHIFRIL